MPDGPVSIERDGGYQPVHFSLAAPKYGIYLPVRGDESYPLSFKLSDKTGKKILSISNVHEVDVR